MKKWPMASLQGSGQIPHEAASGKQPGPKGGLSLWTKGCGPEGSVPGSSADKAGPLSAAAGSPECG